MSVQSGKYVDDLIRRYLQPILAEHGFVRKARTWNREVKSLKHVIDVQAGRWNEIGGGDFTINLGVFIPSVYRVVHEQEPPIFAKEADCIVRVRLGALMDSGALFDGPTRGEKRDHWWKFGTTTDMERLGYDVSGTLIARGIPFLDEFDSVIRVCEILKKYIDLQVSKPMALIYLAVMKYQLGDEFGSRLLFKEVCSRYDSWRDWALVVSTRLGISFDPAET